MRELIARLRDWFRRDQLDRELREELQFHQQQLERDAKVSDHSSESRRLGNITSVREAARERWSIPWLDNLHQDVRYAVRGLLRNPGFTVVVMLTLALGLGANASVFSVLNRIFASAPQGVSDASTLRRVYVSDGSARKRNEFNDGFNYPQWLDLQSVLHDRIVTTYADDSARMGKSDDARTLGVTYIDAAYWRTLGIQPVLGRGFEPEEARIEVPANLAIVSQRVWLKQFGGKSDVLGKTVIISEKSYVIVGVAPSAFLGSELSASDVWLPLGALPMDEGDAGQFWYHIRGVPRLRVVMRVAPDENEAPLNARMANAYRAGAVAGGYPRDSSAIVVTGALNQALGPVKSDRAMNISTRLALVSLLVLLITCANVGNLLLTRLLDRRQELAVRLALGASRIRLATQMFVELLVLAVGSAAAALFASGWAGGILRSMLLPGTRLPDTVIDLRLVVLVMGVAITSAIVLAFVPFLQVRHFDGNDSLKQGQRSISNSGGRLRQVLITGQTAFAVVLLVGAGLCIRSLQQIMSIDVGYDLSAIAFAQPTVLGERGGETSSRPGVLTAALKQEAIRLTKVPGVEGVAFSSHAPIGGLSLVSMRIPGFDSLPKVDGRGPATRSVSPEYFNVVGAKLVSGRLFNESDATGAPLVIVVNETMAKTVWTGKNAIGQCVILYGDNLPCRTVVGIVRDSHWSQVVEKAGMQFFVPLAQDRKDGTASNPSTIIVHAHPQQVASVIANMTRSLSSALPNSRINAQTLIGKLAPQYQPWRMSAVLFAVLGGLGLTVASIGLYGVIAYGVRRRRHELGIRSALGAERSRIVLMVLRQGAKTAAAGTVIGIVLTLGLSRYIESLLYGTSPREPMVYMSVLVVIGLTALLASLVPAWQAGRVSPMTALRNE